MQKIQQQAEAERQMDEILAAARKQEEEEATKAIEAAKSENMLIVIHACDSRAGVKKAAQKKAGNLSSTNGSTNDPAGGNEFVEHSTQDETPSEK